MLKLILFGMIIGIANIIPGVSGGTMAVILGVYDKIISAISNWRTKFIDAVKLLVPIGVGAVVGIVLFANIIEYTLAAFPMATNMVFVGLIIGSVPMIYKKATAEKIKVSGLLSFLVCFGFMVFMMVVTPSESSAITTLTLSGFLRIFLSSAVAAGAMIIPGISGSFVLLLLGLYTTILTAISDFNILILIPVGLGCAVGILGCAKIIERLFAKAPCQTYLGILGFMLGSVPIIFPTISLNIELAISLVLAAGAAAAAYFFAKE
ncbi:MAG: DUF368 domain-containing protein [Faecalibacterium sp.]